MTSVWPRFSSKAPRRTFRSQRPTDRTAANVCLYEGSWQNLGCPIRRWYRSRSSLVAESEAPSSRSLATLHLLSVVSLAVGSTATPPRISAVVTDVDGTLFSFAGRDLSEGNRVALSECVESGVHVSLATGRIPGPWFDALKAQLRGLGPCVFGNGALVVDDSGTPIWEAKLSKEIVSSVLEYTAAGVADGGMRGVCTRCDALGRQRELLHNPLLRALSRRRAKSNHRSHRWGGRAAGGAATKPRRLCGSRCAQICHLDRPWGSRMGVDALDRPGSQGTPGRQRRHHPRPRFTMVRGVAARCQQGTGVERMLAHLSVDPANALACGDAENSVEMLQICGIGAAMANAKPDALAAADVTVASNADDGVAEAIRRFVLPAGRPNFHSRQRLCKSFIASSCTRTPRHRSMPRSMLMCHARAAPRSSPSPSQQTCLRHAPSVHR